MYRREFLSILPAGPALLAGALPAISETIPVLESDRDPAQAKFEKARDEAFLWKYLLLDSSSTIPSLKTAWDLSQHVATSEERADILELLDRAEISHSEAQKTVEAWELSPIEKIKSADLARSLLWVGRYQETSEFFSQALHEFPDRGRHIGQYYGMVHAHYCMGDFQGGLELLGNFPRVFDESHSSGRTIRYKFLLLCAIPRTQEALAEARRYLQNDGFRDPVVAYALSRIGVDFHKLYLEMKG